MFPNVFLIYLNYFTIDNFTLHFNSDFILKIDLVERTIISVDNLFSCIVLMTLNVLNAK